MKLLIEKTSELETTCLVEEIIQEGVTSKAYWIQGPFLQSEVKNHNRRIYRKPVIMKEVQRYTSAKLNDNQAVGELGHPDTPTINLDRVSHKIISLTEDGNNWIGKAKVLDTPFGKIVKNLMDEKVKFGVSSRGLGSLREVNGINEVQDDFYLITPADIVSDPSGPDCFVTAMMEGREWVWENDKLIQQEKAVKEVVEKAARAHKLDEAGLLHVFDQILLRL
jgi:hypothetical protein